MSAQLTHSALVSLNTSWDFSRFTHGSGESQNIFPSDTQSAILLLPGFSVFLHCCAKSFSYTWSESCAESTENVELLFISLCFPSNFPPKLTKIIEILHRVLYVEQLLMSFSVLGDNYFATHKKRPAINKVFKGGEAIKSNEILIVFFADLLNINGFLLVFLSRCENNKT